MGVEQYYEVYCKALTYLLSILSGLMPFINLGSVESPEAIFSNSNYEPTIDPPPPLVVNQHIIIRQNSVSLRTSSGFQIQM